MTTMKSSTPWNIRNPRRCRVPCGWWWVICQFWLTLPENYAFCLRTAPIRYGRCQHLPSTVWRLYGSKDDDEDDNDVLDILDENEHHQHHHHDQTRSSFPVWYYSFESQDWERQKGITPLVAHQTWSWCQNFVLPLQLCPWARTSLETPNALQMFLSDLNPNNRNQDVEDIVLDVGRRFQQFLQKYPIMESSAIFFLVFPHGDFVDFYNWFDDMEESWPLMEDVIIAPFHPDWVFDGEAESLQYEKRSPYPTVTLVSTKVVDRAGEEATRLIGLQNEKTLLSRTLKELQKMWEQSCLQSNRNEFQ